MHRAETVWRKNGDWKARYLKLYSSRGLTQSKTEGPRRISFMSNDSTPYSSLLSRLRGTSTISNTSTSNTTSLLSHRSEFYGTIQGSQQSDYFSKNGTLLLDMVRSQSQEIEDEILDKTPALPCEEDLDLKMPDSCIHGLSMRLTERSVSRSRVSRMSTRRDMDIPSILAFTASTTSAVHLEIPAFQKVEPQREELPRWSIRRSVCPVCSQKWRDRSSVMNIKNSGLKRNLLSELPSVIAPARLRTSITIGFIPHPVPPAVDDDVGEMKGRLRNTSTTWQLTRARRLRMPKPQMPSPEAVAPPSSNAPMARKDLDLRVAKFLTDDF